MGFCALRTTRAVMSAIISSPRSAEAKGMWSILFFYGLNKMTLGIIFAIGAAMTWGLVYVLEQKILTEFSVMKFLFFESIFTLFISVVAALYFESTDSLAYWCRGYTYHFRFNGCYLCK